MKILFIKLKNFSSIYTATQSREISVDFSSCKNKVILFTGENGSGKTSLLSCLHPFAKNGSLDIRNDSPLILIGKEGYKEIHYENNGNIYVIKHFYTPKENSHSVKSYIEKNGTELNQNGNVRSFNALVKEELDIEINYLELVRLGNNVTNFIDKKTTERKSFMGSILSEVDIYLKYFKKVNEDMKRVKSIISHLVDKLGKTGISNIEDSKLSLKEMKRELESLQERIDSANQNLGIMEHEEKKYDSPLEIKSSIEEYRQKNHKVQKLIEKNGRTTLTVETCSNNISVLETSIIEITSLLNSLLEKRESFLNRLDKLTEERADVLSQIQKIESSSEVIGLEDSIKELKKKIEDSSRENHFAGISLPYTKRELEEFIITLDSCNDALLTTYEFGIEPIKKALSFIMSNSDINQYVSEKTSQFKKNKLQAMAEFVFNEISQGRLANPPCKKYTSCPVMKFYDTIYDYATEEPDKIVEDETFVAYTKMASKNLQSIFSSIHKYDSLIKQLPEKVRNLFTKENLLDSILGMKTLYKKSILYDELTIITDYELYLKDLEKYQELKDKLSLVKASLGNNEYFKKRLESINREIDELEIEIEELTALIQSNRDKLMDTRYSLEEMKTLKEYLEKKDSIEKELKTLEDSYEEIREILTKKRAVIDQLQDLTYRENKLQKNYNDLHYRITSYESFQKELKTYSKTYDEMIEVRDALSSKKGIPLLYIQVYLKNIQEITNELLELVYGGKLFLEDFNITAEEFKIPYVSKNTTIEDVSYASQGEKSFISLAISFALIYQAINKYNILLLDEIDSTLDTKNREKFLMILERQISMIDAEQVFLITHNNMFSMYPVDILAMDRKKDLNNNLAHYIDWK